MLALLMLLQAVPADSWDSEYKCAAVKVLPSNWLQRWFDKAFAAQADTFVIERNGWASQDIVTEIARQLLLSRSYEVEVQTYPSPAKKFERISDGTVDFNLEMWFESSRDVNSYESNLKCSVATAAMGASCATTTGNTGYLGRSGWYLSVNASEAAGLDPNVLRHYKVLDQPETVSKLTPLSSVESFVRASAGGTFALPDCAEPGADCAVLLKSVDSYTRGVVESQLKQGDMNLTIAHVGNATFELLAELSSPTLFYHYEPDPRIAQQQFLRIELENDAYCNVSLEDHPTYLPPSISCDFWESKVLKGGNRVKLIVEEPWGIIENLQLEQSDMAALMTLMAKDSTLTSQDAACHWLETNGATWNTWLDRAEKLGSSRFKTIPNLQYYRADVRA